MGREQALLSSSQHMHHTSLIQAKEIYGRATGVNTNLYHVSKVGNKRCLNTTGLKYQNTH